MTDVFADSMNPRYFTFFLTHFISLVNMHVFLHLGLSHFPANTRLFILCLCCKILHAHSTGDESGLQAGSGDRWQMRTETLSQISSFLFTKVK